MKGITDYLHALKFMFHRKVFLFALIPGLMALVFSGLMYMVITNFADELGDWMWSWYTWDFGRSAIESASAWISGAIMVAISIFLFKYIILVLSSPFMSPLSERIESQYTGEDMSTPVTAGMMIEGLMRGLRITFRNIFRELALTVLLLALSFFPVFAPFTSVLLLLTQAYYAGFGNMDFTMERYFSVPDAVDFVREHKIYALGNGIVFVGLLLIPIVGAVIAVPLGAAAATLGVVDRT